MILAPPVARLGDVDPNGDIVDADSRERLLGAIGEVRSVEVDVESQLELTLALLAAARARRLA